MQQCVAFTGDIALLRKTKKELVEITSRTKMEVQKVGLIINSNKMIPLITSVDEQSSEIDESIEF